MLRVMFLGLLVSSQLIQVVQAEITVPVATKEADARTPVLSDIVSGAKGPHRTRPDGTLDLQLDACGDSVLIEAYPVSPHLCPETKVCEEDENLILVVEGCSAGLAFIERKAQWIPYESIIADTLVSELPLAINFDEARELRESLVSSLSENAFGQASRIARDLAALSEESGENDFALKAATTSLDSAFRAVGLEPATYDSPLLELADAVEAYVPSELGREVLTALDADMNLPDEAANPVLVSDAALEKIEAIHLASPPVLHPELVGELGNYFDIFLSR